MSGLVPEDTGINATTTRGKAMFGMRSVFADFERSIIGKGARRPSKGAQRGAC